MEALLSISLDLILAPVVIKIAANVIQSQILPWGEDNVQLARKSCPAGHLRQL